MRPFKAAAILVVLGIVAAACGANAENQSPAASANPSVQAVLQPTATPAEQQATPKDVEEVAAAATPVPTEAVPTPTEAVPTAAPGASEVVVESGEFWATCLDPESQGYLETFEVAFEDQTDAFKNVWCAGYTVVSIEVFQQSSAGLDSYASLAEQYDSGNITPAELQVVLESLFPTLEMDFDSVSFFQEG